MMRVDVVALSACVLIGCFGVEASAQMSGVPSCHNGGFRTRAADLVVIHGASEESLRYTLPDGRTGWLRSKEAGETALVPGWDKAGKASGVAKLGRCDAKSIELALEGGPAGRWDRLPVQVTDTEFRSGDIRLQGRLIAPADSERWPVVILVHGAESVPVVYAWQYLLPAQGVAVFAFDKRGTGRSEGKYTQNFHVLAQDVVAAIGAARRLAGDRTESVGLLAGSQGGWVAPLAASQTRVDFMVVAFGMLVSTLGEDQAQVRYELQRKGYDETVLGRAAEVAQVTAEIVRSGFTQGYERLAEVKQRYGKEPWFAQIQGEYSGEILKSNERELRRNGKARIDNLDVQWSYDPVPTVRGLSMPQLWMVGAQDADAPSEGTIAILRRLQSEGRPIDFAIFPRADHGLVEFDEAPDGTRTRRQYAAGLYDMPVDWIRQRMIGRSYGSASVTLRELR